VKDNAWLEIAKSFWHNLSKVLNALRAIALVLERNQDKRIKIVKHACALS
jgi:hypothetical protein